MSNATTGRFTKWRADWHRMLEASPGFDYFMIRSIVFLLVGIGAVMVMSSTMTWSVLEGATVWNQALRQFMMIIAGLIAFWIALRTRPDTVRRWTPWLLALSFVLLIAVLIPVVDRPRPPALPALRAGQGRHRPVGCDLPGRQTPRPLLPPAQPLRVLHRCRERHGPADRLAG